VTLLDEVGSVLESRKSCVKLIVFEFWIEKFDALGRRVEAIGLVGFDT
jgi:hypothetical protein